MNKQRRGAVLNWCDPLILPLPLMMLRLRCISGAAERAVKTANRDGRPFLGMPHAYTVDTYLTNLYTVSDHSPLSFV